MRKAGIFSRAPWRWTVLGCLLLPWLGACGNADNPKAALSSYNAKARRAHPLAAAAKPGEENPGDMVAAVSATKAGIPVDVKFTLEQKPEIGQPVDVSIVVIPTSQSFDSLATTFQAPDGLDIVDGAQAAPVEKPAPGSLLRHMIRLVPRRKGIYAVTAVVAADSANQKMTRMFLIPVIAGEGMSDSPEKPAQVSPTTTAGSGAEATKGS